jgi:small subunit ribosomal protein S17
MAKDETNETSSEAAEAPAEDAPAAEATGVEEEAAVPSVDEGEPVAVVSGEDAPAEAAEPPPEPEAADASAETDAAAQADASVEDEPAAEPEPAEAAAAEPAAEAETVPAAAEPKRKRKRIPRALRPQRTRPKRERPAARKPIVRLPKPEGERGRRQERRGIVVSSAMDKTIVVKVDTIKAHPKYKKVVRRSTKFHAHDERNEAKVGDQVRIVEIRPLSKTKHWRLAEILEAAK